jgi:hypothetical protein
MIPSGYYLERNPLAAMHHTLIIGSASVPSAENAIIGFVAGATWADPYRLTPSFIKGGQRSLLFIPEAKTKAFKAVAQRQTIDRPKLRIVAKNLSQSVARYPAAEMMDMVHAYIGCKPT